MAELDWLALLFYQSVNQRFDSGSFLRWPRGWWKHAVITRTHKQSVRLHYTSNNQSIIALYRSATGAGIFKELEKIKNSPDCSGVHLKNLEWWYWRASNTIEFGPRLPPWELHGPRTSLIFFFFLIRKCVFPSIFLNFQRKACKSCHSDLEISGSLTIRVRDPDYSIILLLLLQCI